MFYIHSYLVRKNLSYRINETVEAILPERIDCQFSTLVFLALSVDVSCPLQLLPELFLRID